MKHIVLVGGGHAHLSVLQMFCQARPQGAALSLITPSPHQYYSGMLPGFIAGHYSAAQCRIDLRPLAQAAGAKLILERIVGMDAARRCVGLPDGTHLEYDLLSLDVGSEMDASWLQSLGPRLLPLRPLDDVFLRWPSLLAQAQASAHFKLVVVGGGAGGAELALAVAHAFAQHKISASIDVVAGAGGLLASHAEGVRRRVMAQMRRAGIGVHAQRGTAVERAVMLVDGQLLPADAVLAATGARPPYWLSDSGLALDGAGFIAVDAQHRSTSHPAVLAAGDVCARADVAMARSGVHAVHAGPVLGHNLLALLAKQKLKSYRPRRRSLYLLASGRRHAIAS